VAGVFSSNPITFGETEVSNNSGNDDYDIFLAKSIDTSSNSCPDIESFSVNHAPSICEGDSILLSINNNYATYTKWFRDGEQLGFDNKKQIYVKEEGIYTVLINENSRCPVPAIEVIVNNASDLDANTDVVVFPKPNANISGAE
jgi:hypothetical protein